MAAANAKTEPKITPTAKAPAPAPVNPEPTAVAAASLEGDETEGTYRGWVIERPGSGNERASYYHVTHGWTWDKEKATRFETEKAANGLMLPKRAATADKPSRAAGPAANEGAKAVKFDEGADD